MSEKNTRGRPLGVPNKPGHSAGGARPNAGRKPSQSATSSNKNSGGIPTSLPNVRKDTRGVFPIFNMARKSQDTSSTQDNSTANPEAGGSNINEFDPQRPFSFLPESTFSESLHSASTDDQETSGKSPEDDIPADDSEGIITTYLHSVKDRLSKSLTGDVMPFCYRENSFWVRKPDPIFAMRNAAKTDEGLNPTPLYLPDVFTWLPHTIDRRPLTCQNKNCNRYQDPEKRLKDKGWPDTPIARKVIGLECNYYIMTKRFHCAKDASGGCGRSWMLYHPDILKQLEPALADRFPAFLTHRSAIDKTLLALIRAGIVHHISSSAWEEILQELHVREHDIRELWYLQSIQHERMLDAKWQRPVKQYRPFSAFNTKSQYAGYSPSKKFITNVYLDFMENIRVCLDQCVSALPGLILQWDHSFKVPLYMMHLNGIKIFVALFTVLNEFGQVRYQAFVPTKSLVHIRAGMEAITKSLQDHGHPQPILGFTDNVGADIRTFMECTPSLGKSVKLVDPAGLFSHLPQMELPPNVSPILCKTTYEIETACHGILELLDTEYNVTSTINLGFDMEWEYSTGIGGTGSKKTAIIQLALPYSVYLLRVYSLEKLPGPLETVLRSKRIIKIGRNIGADFSKLVQDFRGFVLPNKTGNQYEGIIELGSLAKQKQITSNANTSLSTLVAAVFQKNL
ncbi:hypothetical protein D9758_011549 [Tetrapyrgos nigripes]|uniref:DUF6729 domain-containing protein n=1 Tax=Tetrapyrgos nigripes TaxID=182062 RepID=A0A8H5CQ04_9AGAR|nr:hypothetical protein D9758_011549 [Tetrapyrgos nigripes]